MFVQYAEVIEMPINLKHSVEFKKWVGLWLYLTLEGAY